MQKTTDMPKSRIRKALYVATDVLPHNDSLPRLTGCESETRRLAHLLSTHWDGSANFGLQNAKCLLNKDATRNRIRKELRWLLRGNPEVALFYYSGHGSLSNKGGLLHAYDDTIEADKIELNELIHLSRLSNAKNIVIIIDSCNSGALGVSDNTLWLQRELANIPAKVSLLSASDLKQPAGMTNHESHFSQAIRMGLEGKAADLQGRISIPLLHDYISMRFRKLRQRPQLKVFLKEPFILRAVEPNSKL